MKAQVIAVSQPGLFAVACPSGNVTVFANENGPEVLPGDYLEGILHQEDDASHPVHNRTQEVSLHVTAIRAECSIRQAVELMTAYNRPGSRVLLLGSSPIPAGPAALRA